MWAMDEKPKRGRPKKPPYRPPVWTPEIEQRIIGAVRAGNYVETAAAAAGIDKVTLYRRLKRGARAKSGADHDFSNAVNKAIAESEAEDLAGIRAAGADDWKALAWRMERRFGQRWGRRATLCFETMTPDELIDFIIGEPPTVAEGAVDSPGDREASRR